jgi:hypothetical protein
MYCINLVYSRIDIFSTNYWRSQDIIELHTILKEKSPLIYKTLCMATE